MEINKALPNLPTVSASKIKVYKTCARQYKYKYMIPYKDRPADDKNVAALLGTALHKAIELRYKEGANPSQVFQNTMDDTISEWEKKKLKINAAGYYTTALNVGKKIIREFDWDLYNPLELELAFTLPFPDPQNPIVNVTGYIDMVDFSGMVIDHKSASQAPVQDELDHDPQFVLYAWAYEQMYGVKPYKVIWNHLRTAKQYESNVQHNYDDKIAQLTEDMLAMLEAKRYGRRKMDKVCKTECSFYTLCYGDKPKVVEDNE